MTSHTNSLVARIPERGNTAQRALEEKYNLAYSRK